MCVWGEWGRGCSGGGGGGGDEEGVVCASVNGHTYVFLGLRVYMCVFMCVCVFVG